MVTKEIIQETYIRSIMNRDMLVIEKEQADVVNDYLQQRTGRLKFSLEKHHFTIEGTRSKFSFLTYLRFLDIKSSKGLMSDRRNLSLYNRVIWGVLYHETLGDLRNGLTKDIYDSIKAQLINAVDTQTEIDFTE